MARPKWNPDISEIERLAGLGLTNDEIAYAVGCSPATLYNHKSDNVEFLEAIQRGKAKALVDVANTLYQAATVGKDTRAALEYLRRRGDGWHDSNKLECQHTGAVAVQQQEQQFDDATHTRLAIEWLRQCGYDVNVDD